MAKPIVVVGAGLAGLVCARALHRKGHVVMVLEASGAPGGQMRTDVVRGFRLDRGFQVHFTAYPAAKSELNESALDLKPFESGALIWNNGQMNEVHRDKPLAMALSNYLSLGDKLRILGLIRDLKRTDPAAIFQEEDRSAEEFLVQRGFTSAFLDDFARPFFGGIFLDRSLEVSAKMFRFVWKMIDAGKTGIPARGIGEIPNQIAAEISDLRLGHRVSRVTPESVTLPTGEVIEAERVVVAIDPGNLAGLLPNAPQPTFRASTCIYYETDAPPVDRPILVLNGTGRGQVAEVVPCSVVSPKLAPAGKHLVSVTVLGDPNSDDKFLAEDVKYELQAWFPKANVPAWRMLRVYRIRHAQLMQEPGFMPEAPITEVGGVIVAGEAVSMSSIEGAVQSGLRAAEAVG